MASKKFIQDRITGKIREIEKLNAKMERIEKAELTNWEVNPYCYDERDKHYTLKDLENAKKALADYQAQLVKAEEMEASRNVPVITEFLDRWYDHSVEYFLKEKAKYLEALKEHTQVNQEFHEWYYSKEGRQAGREERNRREDEISTYNRNFHRQWNHVIQFDKGESWEHTMKATLKNEYNRKYDFIITRTNDIVGQITDASNLTVGSKGDLNGYIIGTKGTAKVQTIGAGGYNIQCFHFRTLINPMGEPEAEVESKPELKAEPEVKVTADTNFKAMSLQELKDICTKLGAECKVYDNEAIYRMRLVMAIKKAL